MEEQKTTVAEQNTETSAKPSLNKKVTAGLFWSYAERFLSQIVTTIVSIVLARLIDPVNHGVISVVMIFISICEVFVTSGFGNALVQKKDADDLDFSSIFYFSLGVAIALCALLFSTAPVIGRFYEMPLLSPVIRVMAFRLILSSVNSIQRAYVSKRMEFRKFFRATIIATLLSAVVGVGMAYAGYGIWALVAQYMVHSAVGTITLFLTIDWRPKKMFSVERTKELVSFGWKMLASSLLETIYNNLRSLVIAKKFTEEDLAFYDKGKHFPELIVLNVNSSIMSVIFPAIANVQDDRERVKQMTRRAIRVSIFIMCPLLLGLMMVSEPVVRILLTDKWLPSVPYMQIACLNCLLYPIHTANLQPIIALGRSDIYLRLEIIKKVFGIGILIITLVFFDSVLAIAAGTLVFSVIALVINSSHNKELFGYSLRQELRDIFPSLLLGAAMCVVVWLVGLLSMPLIPELILQILAGAVFYIVTARLFRMESFFYIINIAKGFLRRKRGTT